MLIVGVCTVVLAPPGVRGSWAAGVAVPVVAVIVACVTGLSGRSGGLTFAAAAVTIGG